MVPLTLFKRANKTRQKRTFSKILFTHIDPTYQQIVFNNKRGKNNTVIETMCVKNEVFKSIGMTCSTYRRFTKSKEGNIRKLPQT